MSSQPTYDKVEQGTGVLLGRSPASLAYVGTDGLATCLGVHVLVNKPSGPSQFVAHFDSALEPKGLKDPLYAEILNWVRNCMENALGKFDKDVHLAPATFSAGSFASTKALHDGIRAWSGLDLKMTAWLGFRVAYEQGAPEKIPDSALGRSLSWACAVPLKPPSRIAARRRTRK